MQRIWHIFFTRTVNRFLPIFDSRVYPLLVSFRLLAAGCDQGSFGSVASAPKFLGKQIGEAGKDFPSCAGGSKATVESSI